MGNEANTAGAPQLVLALEAALEVDDETLEQKLADIGKLGGALSWKSLSESNRVDRSEVSSIACYF